MNWTTEKPTVPGWYWWRKIGDKKAQVVEINIWAPHLSTVSLTRSPDEALLHEWNGGEWCGPLEGPQ